MSAQPELYRRPFKPGYLGSYNWPAMALGCTLFLLTNWASTQYIAMRFEYQPVLGDPLFHIGHTPVYPPFAWFLWGLYNITSYDPGVRRPLGEGIVILFFGCAVSIFLYFGANSLRSRRLSANAEHLHGSARWATEQDIRETASWMRAREYTSGAGNRVVGLGCVTYGTMAPSMFWCLPQHVPVRVSAS